MWALTVIFGIAGILNSGEIQSFSEYSNQNPVYEFVGAVPCRNGLKKSGYSISPSGFLFLKQVNEDGSVGEVCSE